MQLVVGLRTRVAVILAAVAICVTGALLAVGSRVINRAFDAIVARQAAGYVAPPTRPLDADAARMEALALGLRRDIDLERRRTLFALATEALGAGVIFAVAAFAFLNRQIVHRTTALAKFVREVDHTRECASRLLDARSDEIGQVAHGVNDLLDTIAVRNRELEAAQTQAVDFAAERARQSQALAAANRLIEQMARTDGLTGLPNRRMFDERLAQQISRSRRDGETFSLLLADLDHFKTVNDRAGHAVGDRVLIHAASVFAATTRTHDTAARHGGDEFAVLLPATACEEAAHAGERIRAGIAALQIAELQGPVTISVAVAEWRPGESSAALGVRVDRLLAEAKDRGRNQVRTEVRALRRSIRL